MSPPITNAKRVATLLLILVSLLFSSCSLTGKALYFDDEQAVAEKAVSSFHQLHNQQKVEEILALITDLPDDSNVRSQVKSDIKLTFEKVGQLKTSQLSQHKVIPHQNPGYRSQVRLVYDSEFEKGNFTEFFVWNINDNRRAELQAYKVVPKGQEGELLKQQ